MSKEEQIQKYMVSLGISLEEAIRRYEQSEKPREKTQRKQKIDEEKVAILSWILDGLMNRHRLIEEDDWDFEEINLANPQKEITFKVGENEYSISLIKHRKKEV